MRGGDGLSGWATPPTYETDSPHTEQGVHMRNALESTSLSHVDEQKNHENTQYSRDFIVGLAGFEPTTP